MKTKFYSILAYLLSTLFFILILGNCTNTDLEYKIEVKVNPYNNSPLTALLEIKSEKPCQASVKVMGKNPIEQSFDISADSLNIPVLGLYPDTTNEVVVTLIFEDAEVVEKVNITTGPIPVDFPEIEINKIDRKSMEPGLHACDFHFANHGKFRTVPIIFDDQGIVRWYLDLSYAEEMMGPFQRLKDGTILMASRHTLYEFDMLGKKLKQTPVDDIYGMHHDNIELPNGNLLLCVGKRNEFINVDGENIQSDSDFIILFDRKNSTVLKEWDLAKHLDVDRRDINHIGKNDWLHMNGLAFDEKDSSIIISGKNQGVIKISWDDELQWIMAPKKNWGYSGRNGDGPDTKPYLLTAVNAAGTPYSTEVQEGTVSADNFDFPWGQHAPKILSNGNILLFDNGSVRNFKFAPNYSRAVEYKVNEKDRTVEQVWQYGKERGQDFFSLIISDADMLPNTKNILVTSGHLMPNAKYSAKIVEVDHATGKEVFEATLYYKTMNGDKTFGWGQMDILYRSERMELKYGATQIGNISLALQPVLL